ncbi:hypothetical protein [Methylocucumis oryzae]|uniref:Fibronectin type-III domain-containing protein n=1 Tax=Methylocucumis oryzae TaxID=1632867 RepID=A0A0F3IEK8_9GAMM|nr:hypothetical protein [Methylocucumis oryzae]KJV05240.1 hypothetical protein VZ94_19625 [Methylocucumis oryzae]
MKRINILNILKIAIYKIFLPFLLLFSTNSFGESKIILTGSFVGRQIILKWQPVAGAIHYGVCYATEPIDDISKCLDYSGGTWDYTFSTNYKTSNLNYGTNYFFRVLSEESNGAYKQVSNLIEITPIPIGSLNDTGIVNCFDMENVNSPCPVNDYPNQDAEFGRDKLYNDESDGKAGFSYTKIDQYGVPLSIDAKNYSCTKDNVSGLMWERKGSIPDLNQDSSNYSWFNPSKFKNGGNPGLKISHFGCKELSFL